MPGLAQCGTCAMDTGVPGGLLQMAGWCGQRGTASVPFLSVNTYFSRRAMVYMVSTTE